MSGLVSDRATGVAVVVADHEPAAVGEDPAEPLLPPEHRAADAHHKKDRRVNGIAERLRAKLDAVDFDHPLSQLGPSLRNRDPDTHSDRSERRARHYEAFVWAPSAPPVRARLRVNRRGTTMERLWSRAVATGGQPVANGMTASTAPDIRNPLRWVATGCRAELLGLQADQALGVSDGLVGEEDDAVTEALGADEAHGLLVAGLAEEALARPEHDWEDLHPKFVDEVVLYQHA